MCVCVLCIYKRMYICMYVYAVARWKGRRRGQQGKMCSRAAPNMSRGWSAAFRSFVAVITVHTHMHLHMYVHDMQNHAYK